MSAQPIATAPRDGTAIMLWDGQWVTGYWIPNKPELIQLRGVRPGRWELLDAGSYAEDAEVCFPTHWHPLPANPQ